MAQRAALPADDTRHVVAVARAVTAASRSWSFYPPDHPAVGLALDRLAAAFREVTVKGPFQVAVTPRALLVDGTPLESADVAVADCAALLHDRHILQLAVVQPPSDDTLRAFLAVLSLDAMSLREGGGPAVIWEAREDPTILIEQIDYQEILERESEDTLVRRDSTWKAIVRSIISGRRTFTPEEQQRLLEISRDAGAIGELAADCRAPFHMADGTPLLTTQAATVLAVYRHVASTVSVLEPDRAAEVVGTLGLATTALDTALALELLRQPEADDDSLRMVSAIRGSFDDQEIAMLLARALAAPGQPTRRLADVLGTLAPDDARRRRIVQRAEEIVGAVGFPVGRPLSDIRRSVEELLLGYDEKSYVSDDYRRSMDQAGARAADLAARDLPPELGAWLESIDHVHVRQLSTLLLVDLLRLETSPERARELAADMAAFADDLLAAGAYADAGRVVAALRDAAGAPGHAGAEAALTALETVGGSSGFVESVAVLGQLGAEELGALRTLVAGIGPPAAPALVRPLERPPGDPAATRALELLVALGPGAIDALAAAANDPRWDVQQAIARALGAIGTAAAVPPLQVLLRKPDARVVQEAATALAHIGDQAALRALQTALRAATGDVRDAVIAALVQARDARVTPLLVRLLAEGDPLGADHEVVVATLEAIGALRDDRVVPTVAALARARRWLQWGRTTRLRGAALGTLSAIGSPAARAALDELARTGDWFLRRLARQAAGGAR